MESSRRGRLNDLTGHLSLKKISKYLSTPFYFHNRAKITENRCFFTVLSWTDMFLGSFQGSPINGLHEGTRREITIDFAIE